MVAIGLPVQAQQTYKCTENGRTVYSGQPCRGGAEQKVLSGTPSPPAQSPASGGSAAEGSNMPINIGARTCIDEIPRKLAFMDPESLRIGEPTGGKVELIDYHNQGVLARRYQIGVNAKNSFGAYAGSRPVSCITSEDGRRILRMDTSRFN